MSAQDRARWDKIYREMSDKPYPPPDPLLFEMVPPPARPESRALDFASGVGQNGLWLAGLGYHVDLMDISRVALARARGEMAMRNLRNVNLLQVDVDEVSLDPTRYEVVCVFRYLRRSLLPELANTVTPGGRIIYETYNPGYLAVVPGFNPDFLLHPGELAAAFTGWKVLVDSEIEHISQFVAVKPADTSAKAKTSAPKTAPKEILPIEPSAEPPPEDAASDDPSVEDKPTGNPFEW